MTLFSGKPGATAPAFLELPPPVLANRSRLQYFCEDGLANAVNVALMMGQPLLVTGPTGSGKTHLAHAIAAEFDLPLVTVSVRSETRAEDLFYRYDQVARFGDRQNDVRRPEAHYLRFTGLGLALLRAGGAEAPLQRVPSKREGPQEIDGPQVFGDIAPDSVFDPTGPANSVVLIDELDKAPRDTPNDMLAWIEDGAFDIDEVGLRVEVPPGTSDAPAARPIIVITSNSEKALPDPFLRRCVYYEIPPLKRETLGRIARATLSESRFDADFAVQTVDFIEALRAPGALSRPPGTAEFVGWLMLIVDRLDWPAGEPLHTDPARLERTLPALVKLEIDRDLARRIVADWSEAKRTGA